MAVLSQRIQCVKTGCLCAAFVRIESNPTAVGVSPHFIPQTSNDICDGCHHPYISHQAPDSVEVEVQNRNMRKGGYAANSCGGFLSSDSIWNMTSPCICGAIWLQHEMLVRDGPVSTATNTVPSTQIINPQVAGVSGTSTQSSLLQTSAHPPIVAFQGLPAPAPGNTASRRAASAIRTLPQHQGSRQRRPRHPFPQTAAFAAGTTTPDKVELGVIVTAHGQCPTYIDLDHPSKDIKLGIDHLPDYFQRHLDHNLFFMTNLSATGTVWQELNAAIWTHLSSHSISLPSAPSTVTIRPGDMPFHQLSWILLEPGRQLRDGDRKYKHATIQGVTCTSDELLKLGKKTSCPLPAHPGYPVIWIAPRYGNVMHHLMGFVIPEMLESVKRRPHPCFADRLIGGLLPGDETAECYEDCPQHDVPTVASTTDITDTSNIPSEVSLGFANRRRTRSPLSDQNPQPSNRPRLVSDQNMTSNVFLDSEDFPLFPSEEERSVSPPTVAEMFLNSTEYPFHSAYPFHPVNISPSPVTVEPLPSAIPATIADIQHWQSTVRSHITVISDEKQVLVWGDSLENTAEITLQLLLHIHSRDLRDGMDATFNPPDGLIDCRTSVHISAFMQPYRTFKIGVNGRGRRLRTATTIGVGVERGTWRVVLDRISKMREYWQKRGSYLSPLFTPTYQSTPERLTFWRTFGSIIAIHMFIFGQCPAEFSPFVPLTLEGGAAALDVSPSYIALVDHVTAEKLKPWHALKYSDPRPTLSADPLGAFLAAELGMQLYQIDKIRTPETHKAWTHFFTRYLTLGPIDPWTHPEFLAMQEGFDVPLNSRSKSRRLLRTFEDAFNKDFTPALIAAMCNRKVTSPDEVLERLEYHVEGEASDEIMQRYCELFKRHMHRYIKGVGHPNHEDVVIGDFLSPEVVAEEAENRTLRAELLLTVATDSNLLPTESTWSIQFNFSTSPVSGQQPEASIGPSSSTKGKAKVTPPWNVHTCHRTVGVTIDSSLAAALLEEPPADPSVASTFDKEVHFGQLLYATYNTI